MWMVETGKCVGEGDVLTGVLHKVDGCAGEDRGGKWARTA